MSAVVTAAAPSRTAGRLPARDFERWRRRSRLIRPLRVVLPAAIALILAGLVGSVAWSHLQWPSRAQAAEADEPIRLINPRFVGRDDKGRAFVLTAESAMRDEHDYQRVMLEKPALVLDEKRPGPGAHQRRRRRLSTSRPPEAGTSNGGVKMADAQERLRHRGLAVRHQDRRAGRFRPHSGRWVAWRNHREVLWRVRQGRSHGLQGRGARAHRLEVELRLRDG